MRRILICTGVLGGGTALVFAAAGVASVLMPTGRLIPAGPNVLVDRAMPVNAVPLRGRVVVVGADGGWGTGVAPPVAIPAPDATFAPEEVR